MQRDIILCHQMSTSAFCEISSHLWLDKVVTDCSAGNTDLHKRYFDLSGPFTSTSCYANLETLYRYTMLPSALTFTYA